MGTPVSASTAQCTQVVALAEPQPGASSSCVPLGQAPSVHTVAWAGTGGQGGGSHEDVCIPGQFLWEVDPGLPAEKAGMQAGDRLVAVAGESVEGLGHEETVSKIRAQGSRVSLIVVDPKADRFFSMVRAEGPGLEKGPEWSRAQVREEQQTCPLPLFQVRLSPLLFLESTEAPDSPRGSGSASVVESKSPPVEDTAVAPVPGNFRQCFLYPGPGGGYGFRLSRAASKPGLFISQVTDAPGTFAS